MDPYHRRKIRVGKAVYRSQSNLSNCVIEFNPVTTAHHTKSSDSRPSTRPHSRQSDYDGSQVMWSVKDSRTTTGTPSRLSRSKRQTPHEMLNSVIGDHIIFSESPSAPGIPIVFRPPEERTKNPERLNLDRRNLAVCPILEGEDRLRLLNLQHNAIKKIQNLSHLRRLVFLDLYDNQITQISGIDELTSLRVLMLGKNRIENISGLENLHRLDVLDLHGNRISELSGLGSLGHLRVLNLAGNFISVVAGLSGLKVLTELNLRRNRVTQVLEVDQSQCLQRLFLSHNHIQEWADVQCISDAPSIVELSLDGNPFSSSVDPYRMLVLSQMRQLHHLDMIPISDDERELIDKVRRSVEEERKQKEHIVRLQEKRESTIARISKQWERLHGGHMMQSASCASMKDFKDAEPLLSKTRSQNFCDILSANSSSFANLMRSESSVSSRSSLVTPVPPPPVSYVEVLEGALHLYGSGALEALETRSFGSSSESIKSLAFHYVEFVKILPYLHKMSTILPSLKNLEFHCCNLSTYGEINALAVLPVLNGLTVTEDGNPFTKMVYWRTYIIYRLSHLQLVMVNNQEVATEDLITSEQTFGGLGHVCSLLPHSRLLEFVSSQKSTKKQSAKKRGVNQEPLSRAPLVHPSNLPHMTESKSAGYSQSHCGATVTVGSKVVESLVEGAVAANVRLRAFEEMWPDLFEEFVEECREEMKDLNSFMREGVRSWWLLGCPASCPLG